MSEMILTVTEAAKYLRLREETVRRLLSQGDLPGTKVGRSWRILESELETYLRTNSGEPA